VIYNIVIDRFNNGDVSNDKANIHQQQKDDLQKNKYRADMRHGGDLEGIRKRLPYMKDLGVTAIWMTPVFTHNGDYHGYCTSDPTQVDPGFGTNELLRVLVKEAHELGILVVLDIVINHLCDLDTKYDQERSPGDAAVVQCANHKNKLHWDGAEGGEKQMAMKFSDSFFPGLKSDDFFNRCGSNTEKTMGSQDPLAVYGDFALGMFDYNTRDKGFQQIFTEIMKFWIAFADVDGFRLDAAKHVTEDFLAYFSTEVRLYAKNLGKTNFFTVGEVAATVDWQARRIGAMASDLEDPNRHDTKLGMPKTVTKTLVSLKADYQAHDAFRMPGMDSVYNFYASGKARSAMHGVDGNGWKAYVGSLGAYVEDGGGELSSVMGQLQDCCASAPEGCTGQMPKLWTLLEIHDWPRFTSRFPNDLAFAKVGFAWLFTFPGQPIIYYGQEHGFNNECPEAGDVSAGDATEELLSLCAQVRELPGDCRADFHPFFRQDMYTAGPLQLGSVVPEVDARKAIDGSKLSWIGTPDIFTGDWTEDPALNRNHELYKFVRKLTRLRRSCPALVSGQTRWGIRGYDSRPPRAVMVYSRVEGDTEVVVVINPDSSASTHYQFECDPSINKDGAVFRDVLDGDVFQTFKVQIRENRCFLNPEKYQDGKIEPYTTRILINEDKLVKKKDGDVNYHPDCDGMALCSANFDENLCAPHGANSRARAATA
jgi:glycosidase